MKTNLENTDDKFDRRIKKLAIQYGYDNRKRELAAACARYSKAIAEEIVYKALGYTNAGRRARPYDEKAGKAYEESNKAFASILALIYQMSYLLQKDSFRCDEINELLKTELGLKGE